MILLSLQHVLITPDLIQSALHKHDLFLSLGSDLGSIVLSLLNKQIVEISSLLQ